MIIAGAVDFPASVSVWSYDGAWGGEAVLPTPGKLSQGETAVLALDFAGHHPIRLISVSHRGEGTTTIHFEGEGEPPFSPHAVPKVS